MNHQPKETEKPRTPEETTKTPSVEELRRMRGQLEEKLKEAQRQKAIDIQNKLGERELLIQEAKRTDELLHETQDTLAYFQRAKKSGELQDPADLQKLGELENLEQSLLKQREVINKKIEVLSQQPEILEHLEAGAREEYGKVEKTREREAAIEQAQKEIYKLVKDSAEKLVALANRWMELSVKYDSKILPSYEKTANQLGDFVKSLSYKIDDSGLNRLFHEIFGQELHFADQFDRQIDFEEMKERLLGERKKLGFFKGGDKKIVDKILANEQLLRKYEAERAGAKKALDELNSLSGRRYRSDDPLTTMADNIRASIKRVKDNLATRGIRDDRIELQPLLVFRRHLKEEIETLNETQRAEQRDELRPYLEGLLKRIESEL